jgi:hypothetical protein
MASVEQRRGRVDLVGTVTIGSMTLACHGPRRESPDLHLEDRGLGQRQADAAGAEERIRFRRW